LDGLRAMLPEMPEKRIESLVATHGIPRQQAAQLLEDGFEGEFEALAGEFGEPQVAANMLTYHFAEIRREGLDVDALPLDRLRDLLRAYREGAFAKEAIPSLLRYLVREDADISAAVRALGLGPMSEADVDRILDELVASHAAMIRERGEKAIGPLMGVAMGRLRGKVDGGVLNEKLRKRLAAR